MSLSLSYVCLLSTKNFADTEVFRSFFSVNQKVNTTRLKIYTKSNGENKNKEQQVHRTSNMAINTKSEMYCYCIVFLHSPPTTTNIVVSLSESRKEKNRCVTNPWSSREERETQYKYRQRVKWETKTIIIVNNNNTELLSLLSVLLHLISWSFLNLSCFLCRWFFSGCFFPCSLSSSFSSSHHYHEDDSYLDSLIILCSRKREKIHKTFFSPSTLANTRYKKIRRWFHAHPFLCLR